MVPHELPQIREDEFVDRVLDGSEYVEITRRGKVRIVTSNGTVFVVRNRALTQLKRLLELERITWRDAEYVARLLRERYEAGKAIVISGARVPGEEGVYVVYRVTTEEYAPVPHSVLFNVASDALREAGVASISVTYKRFFKRTAAFFEVARVPIRYAREGDAVGAYLAVSNANTGYDAIHVYGYLAILACRNGLVSKRFLAFKAIAHRGELELILTRVRAAVIEVAERIRTALPELVGRIEALQAIELDAATVEAWRIGIVKKVRLAKSYERWFDKILRENIETFGSTAEALFQTLTYFVSRLSNRSVDTAERLNREAEMMLENPRGAIEAIVSLAR